MLSFHLLALAAKALAHARQSSPRGSDSSDPCLLALERAVVAEPQWWRALALFAASFAWFALPLERVPAAEQKGGLLRQLGGVLRYCGLAVVKLLALVAAAAWLQRAPRWLGHRAAWRPGRGRGGDGRVQPGGLRHVDE